MTIITKILIKIFKLELTSFPNNLIIILYNLLLSIFPCMACPNILDKSISSNDSFVYFCASFKNPLILNFSCVDDIISSWLSANA